MCDATPQISSARVFAADGVTPVTGKGPLVQGADYSLAYNAAACELTLNDVDGRFGDRRRRTSRIAYRTRLDAGYSIRRAADERGRRDAVVQRRGHESRPHRLHAYVDQTAPIGVVDHEDAHTVTIVPRLYADKAAALQVDSMSPGIVDPGDVLRYTIRIYNNGSCRSRKPCCATRCRRTRRTFADSMTLNGQPVRRPDGGVSPLVAGVDVSSSNLTPPLPGAGAGTLSPGQQRGRAIRSARQRRRAARHGDREPSRRRHCGVAGPADRR